MRMLSLFEAIREDDVEAVSEILNSVQPSTLSDENRESPVALAAEYSSLAIVLHLLKAGWSPEGQVSEVFSPIYRAIVHRGDDRDRAAIVRALIDAGADPSRVVVTNSNLAMAVRLGRNDIVELLLERGCLQELAEVGGSCGKGGRPLEVAMLAENHEAVEIINRYLGD